MKPGHRVKAEAAAQAEDAGEAASEAVAEEAGAAEAVVEAAVVAAGTAVIAVGAGEEIAAGNLIQIISICLKAGERSVSPVLFLGCLGSL